MVTQPVGTQGTLVLLDNYPFPVKIELKHLTHFYMVITHSLTAYTFISLFQFTN